MQGSAPGNLNVCRLGGILLRYRLTLLLCSPRAAAGSVLEKTEASGAMPHVEGFVLHYIIAGGYAGFVALAEGRNQRYPRIQKCGHYRYT